ncbi:MFS transporter [Actinomadura atramentaria]|uniref:MFS transporter n=1 Tax=Actinomadura atramentaria TaxID=1990 RepID=UPI001F0A83D0|nr:MFS transporter [Actinomadura atramentaria]
MLAVTVLGFDELAVGTAMPTVARELDGLGLYAWGFSATLIGTLLATVLGGGWADRSGPARPVLTGLALFALGLVLAGTAVSMPVFVLARAVQGLGAGTALVGFYVLIARAYPEELLPRIFATMAAAWIVPSLAGPALAGLVTDHAGWRWIFLGLLPPTAPAVAMLVPALHRSTEPNPPPAPPTEDARDPARAGGAGSGGKAGGPERVVGGRRRIVAAVGVSVGAALLLWALDHPTLRLLPLGIAGAAGLAAGLPCLLPAGTLRMRRGLPSVVLTRALMGGAFIGMNAFVPLALTRLYAFSPTQAGVALTTGAIAWSAAAQYQGRSARSGAFFAVSGAVLLLAGVVGVAVALQVSGWVAAPVWMLGGAGMGFSTGALSVLLLKASPEEEQGVNSSALQIGDTLGSALIVGVFGAVLSAFGSRFGLGLAVIGGLCAAVAALAVISALRLEES